MACTNNTSSSVSKQLLNRLGEIPDRRCISLLNEKITWIGMLECKHNQINCLVQIHKETSHIRVRYSNRVSCLNLINKERNDTTTTAHHITVPCAADSRIATFCCHTGIGIDNMFHHSLRNAHSIDGVRRFIS